MPERHGGFYQATSDPPRREAGTGESVKEQTT